MRSKQACSAVLLHYSSAADSPTHMLLSVVQQQVYAQSNLLALDADATPLLARQPTHNASTWQQVHVIGHNSCPLSLKVSSWQARAHCRDRQPSLALWTPHAATCCGTCRSTLHATTYCSMCVPPYNATM